MKHLTPPPRPITWVVFDVRKPSHWKLVTAQTWVEARGLGVIALGLGSERDRVWAVAPLEGEQPEQAIRRVRMGLVAS